MMMTARNFGTEGEALSYLLGMSSAAYQVAARVLGSRQDAEDVLQNAYASALQHLPAERSAAGLRAWFLKVVTNAAWTHLRREGRRRSHETARKTAFPTAPPEPESGSGPTPEVIRALAEAMDELDEKYRLPVALCFEQGLSRREAAEVLGQPESTVADRVRTGLLLLRRYLGQAGLACADAALVAALAHTAPGIPEGLEAALGNVLAGGGGGAPAGPVAAGAGGGLSTKVLAGLLAVAILTGSAALVNRALSPSPPPEGPRIEHLAFCQAGQMYIDGPALEASCPVGRPGPGRMDDDGNVWFGHGGGETVGTGGRCLETSTGLIRPCFGNDYWSSRFPVDEGPASAMPITTIGYDYARSDEGDFVWGAPLRGEGSGFLLFSNGGVVRKVFRNPERGNRWWFRRIVGGGKEPLPTSRGGAVAALDAKLGYRTVDLQVMPGGRIVVYNRGGFYEYRDGALVCLLGFDDYKDSGLLPPGESGLTLPPESGVLGGDGTFYLGSSGGAYGGPPCVWRIRPGGALEPYARTVTRHHRDGPGTESGTMGGHFVLARMHNFSYLPADFLAVAAHDEWNMRRLRGGRISSLCRDGQWREWERGTPSAEGIPIAAWFHTWAPGPNGTATSSSKTGSHCSRVTYLVTGIDYGAPTVGPLLGGVPRQWPPEAEEPVAGGEEQ